MSVRRRREDEGSGAQPLLTREELIGILNRALMRTGVTEKDLPAAIARLNKIAEENGWQIPPEELDNFRRQFGESNEES